MRVVGLDHLVLTVASIERTVDFYTRVLGMTAETFGPERRVALRFGPHKINLHQVDRTFEPKAAHPGPGTGGSLLPGGLPRRRGGATRGGGRTDPRCTLDASRRAGAADLGLRPRPRPEPRRAVGVPGRQQGGFVGDK